MVRPKLVLPKSWNHWLKKYGFKEHKGRGYKSTRGQPILYFLGKGRVWRVCLTETGYGIQRGDHVKDFDRWALCSPIVEHDGLPKNEKEFVNIINFLKQESDYGV